MQEEFSELQDDGQQQSAFEIFKTLQGDGFSGEGQGFALAALFSQMQGGSPEIAAEAVEIYLRRLESSK